MLTFVFILCLLAISVIGIIEHVKVWVATVKAKKAAWPLIAQDVACLAIGAVGAPILFGAEILGTIMVIFFASGLGILTLAFTQLFYDLILKLFKALLTKLTSAPVTLGTTLVVGTAETVETAGSPGASQPAT